VPLETTTNKSVFMSGFLGEELHRPTHCDPQQMFPDTTPMPLTGEVPHYFRGTLSDPQSAWVLDPAA